MKLTLTNTLSALAICSALTAPSIASAEVDREAVMDQRGNFVYDFRGNCVRTHWAAGSDVCAEQVPAKEAVIADAVVERPVSFSKAERTIYFDFDSAQLTADSRQKLDNIAQAVNRSGQIVNGSIIGHTDPLGTGAYNQALSQRRAKSVQDYLATKGYIDTRVVTTTGKGETQLVKTSCDDATRAATIECLQPNRRVEIEFDYKTTTAKR